MQDYIKFEVVYNSDGSPYLLWIDYFLNGQFSDTRYVSRSFDWFFPMIASHARCFIFDSLRNIHTDTYYCFDSPDYPRCLAALFATLEEHQEDIEEYDYDDLPF